MRKGGNFDKEMPMFFILTISLKNLRQHKKKAGMVL
jgi:hypothetical protein